MNKVLHSSKIQNHSFLAPRTDLDNVKRRIIIYWGLISSKNRFIYGLNEGRVLVGGGGVELPEQWSSPRYRPPTPMVIKEIPFKCSTCKTSAGVYKRNPI